MKITTTLFSLLTSILLLPCLVHAEKKAYEITTKVFVNGSLIDSPKIITQEGRAAEVKTVNEFPPGNLKVIVVPHDTSTREARKNIQLNFDIAFKNGTQELKYAPEIKTKLGTEATAILKNKEGQEQMKIVVITKTTRVYEDNTTTTNKNTESEQSMKIEGHQE